MAEWREASLEFASLPAMQGVLNFIFFAALAEGAAERLIMIYYYVYLRGFFF